MGVTTGPDGIPTITVTPQNGSTSNTGSSSAGSGVPGGNLPLVSTVQQAINTGSGGFPGVPGGSLPLTSSIQGAANSVTQPASAAASQDTWMRWRRCIEQAVIQTGPALSWHRYSQTNLAMIFPYTPTINFTQAVSYMDLQLVHSNTDYPAYTRTPSVTISVSGKFTVQNQAEGAYALACLPLSSYGMSKILR